MLFFEIGPGRYVNLHDCREVQVNVLPHYEPGTAVLQLIYDSRGSYSHEITKDQADAICRLLGPTGVIGKNSQQVVTELKASPNPDAGAEVT